MPPDPPRSNCSVGVSIDFYWWCHDACDGHIEAAVDALWEAVEQPGRRRWNPFSTAMAKGEFRKRLKQAASGDLIPVDHVKKLNTAWPGDLFEIRWQGIDVCEMSPDHRSTFKRIKVRLIHGEPTRLGLVAIGLHAHEKTIMETSSQTRAAQDAEIEIAVRRYADCERAAWAVTGG